jgi:hypothetical protein
MYDMEDEPVAEPLETIHLYVVREGPERPSLLPVFMSLVALSLLIAIGVLTPYQQPEQRALIRVPAVLLPLKTFTSTVAIIPTGMKTFPATVAHGTLTITNGSILAEELPKGMIFTGKDGVEVITDATAFVPAGSAAGYGVAYVSAHAAMSGKSGNIPTLDIDTVEGSSIYVRNLYPFTSGAESYRVKFITVQDRQNALAQARVTLLRPTLSGLLYSPCLEHVAGTTSLHVAWTCQFFTYSMPSFFHVRVLHVQVIGGTVLVTIMYAPRPQHLETK